MERILVVGSPGAGKTTLSLRLGKMLELPVIHLDVLHWRDNWQETPQAEFDQLLAEALSKPKWIIDGNYARTVPERLKKSTSVIFLDYPTRICIWGALRRFWINRGKSRPDMGGFCPERLDWKFISYILMFRRKQRPNLIKLFQNVDIPVYYLHSRKEMEAFLRSEAPGWQ